jgi:hypothetical protein
MQRWRWSTAQIAEVASAKSQNELIPLLEQNSAKYVEVEYIYYAIITALQMDNVETAENLAKLYSECQVTSYLPYEDLLAKQRSFSWIQFIDNLALGSRDLHKVRALAPELAKHHLIRVLDFIKRPLRSFHGVISGIKDPFQDSEILFEIISNNERKLDRSDRLNMLEMMQRYKRISFEPSTDKLSLCIASKRQYLMKYFLDLPNLTKWRGPDGENFLAHVAIKHPHLKYLKLFTKDQLKNLLMEKHTEMYVADLLPKFLGNQYTMDSMVALKELLKEGKLKDCKKLLTSSLGNLGAKFFHQHGGIFIDTPEYQRAISTYLYNESKPEKVECVGNSIFCFEELPLEIVQIIFEELNSRSIWALFCTSKSLNKLKDRFKCIFYEHILHKEFPTIYSSLIDQSSTSIDWKQKVSTLARRTHNWQTCHEPKIIKLDECCRYGNVLAFDENWLILEKSTYPMTFLWNVRSQQLHTKTHKYFYRGSYCMALLDSPELVFPTCVSVSDTIATVADFNGTDTSITSVHLPVNSNSYVAAISRSNFLTGRVPIVHDLESNQTIARIDEISLARQAAHNKITQITLIADTKGAVYMTDKNFAVTHAMKTDQSYYGRIEWLDEFSFFLTGYPTHQIGDIRMPKDFVHERNSSADKKPIHIVKRDGTSFVHSTGNCTLQFSTNHRLACVWDIKNYTWSNVFTLPDEVFHIENCTSRYAVYQAKDHGICLLDFDQKV